MTAHGLLEETGEHLRLTRPGLLLANSVFCEFL
jgi:coproporphyrinogen III oxidase-like Fe-S oxidoreductase